MKVLPIEKLHYFIILIVTLSLSSCISSKSLIYFQNKSNSKSPDSIPAYIPIYCINDLLAITVNGADETAVQPFNKMSGNSSGLNSEGSKDNKVITGGEYLIDENGTIDFPVIGKLKVAGLNQRAFENILIEKLKEYVADPVVDIRIKNFKVTLLGEIGSPGTISVADNRITLLQAISLSGDLKVTGLHYNVLVIREINGKPVEFRVDLTSKEVFNSPVYYLRQNDIVYVEPHRGVSMTANNASTGFVRSNLGLVTSVFSVVLTFLVLLNVKK